MMISTNVCLYVEMFPGFNKPFGLHRLGIVVQPRPRKPHSCSCLQVRHDVDDHHGDDDQNYDQNETDGDDAMTVTMMMVMMMIIIQMGIT